MIYSYNQRFFGGPVAVAASNRHSGRGVLLPAALLLVLSAGTLRAADLTLEVSSESAPAGGWTQIKVRARTPANIATGGLSMDFDQAFFNDVSNLAVFSPAGDAIGYANVKGHHLDAHFSSPSGSIGQPPDLPVFVVSLPVFIGAVPGSTTSVTLVPSASVWRDPQGNSYAVAVTPGTFTVGGTLSVTRVTPGGGPLPAGAILQISGAGFTPSTSVSIDSVSISSVDFVSAQQINVTLAEPAEITGRRIRLATETEQVDYYSSLSSAPANATRPISGVQPIVPLATFSVATVNDDLVYQPFDTDGLALLNQTLAPITVEMIFSGRVIAQETITIPPGDLYLLNVNSLVNPAGSSGGELWILASSPIRMLEYFYHGRPIIYGQPPTVSVSTPGSVTTAPPPLRLPISADSISWSRQKGAAIPAARTVAISGDLAFTVATKTGGVPWLNVTTDRSTAPATLTLSPAFSALPPGDYTAAVALTPVPPPGLPNLAVQPVTIDVSLTVSAFPLVSVTSEGGTFVAPQPGGPLFGNPGIKLVTTNGDPAPVTAVVTPISGGNWLSVTPSSATTPAVLTLTANTTGLEAGTYYAHLDVQGPGNVVGTDVQMLILAPPNRTILRATPANPSWLLQAGANPPVDTRVLSVLPADATISASVVTQSGGGWLSAEVSGNSVRVAVNSAGLPVGLYLGTLKLTSSNYDSVDVPVALKVWAPPPPQTTVTVRPSSVSLTVASGQAGDPQSLAVESGGVPVLYSIEGAAGDVAAYLGPDGRAETPGRVTLFSDARNLQPGIYRWNVVIRWTNGTVSVPVTLTVTPASTSAQPSTRGVVNAASHLSGPISPGSIISIFGTGLASATGGLRLDPSGRIVTIVNGAEVSINGVSASLLYVSATQLNAIVPYEVGSSGSAQFDVRMNGVPSATPLITSITPTSPAIFTVDATGQGQAAVLNEDSSVNSQLNPAARGSVVQIFATGEGQTSPPGITGSITQSDLKVPNLPVNVSIGGVDAQVLYAGSAPAAVAGLFQVNAVVPPSIQPGSSRSIVLTVGDAHSRQGVTIAVK